MKQVRQGILWCKIKAKDNVFIIINIHAPNVKQAAFLSKLNEITANEKDRKHLLVVGDFNAQLGINDMNQEDEKWIGKMIGHDKCNDNGETFKIFLHTAKLKNVSSKIGMGTEITWRSGSRCSQIDHILSPTMTDFKIKYIRGNWTHLNTDHKLITIGIKFEKIVRNTNERNEPTKINLELLKDNKIKEKY